MSNCIVCSNAEIGEGATLTLALVLTLDLTLTLTLTLAPVTACCSAWVSAK